MQLVFCTIPFAVVHCKFTHCGTNKGISYLILSEYTNVLQGNIKLFNPEIWDYGSSVLLPDKINLHL